MRFINDDISLAHDQRYVPYSNSGVCLLHKMNSLATDLGCSNTDPFDLVDDDIYAQKIIKRIMNSDPSIQCDNVYGINIENFMRKFYRQNKNDIGQANDLIGLHTLDNGLTFYGFIAGGDGQRGVFIMIYDDGDHLRLYTPRWGNKLNLNRHEPLMNDERSEKYMARYGINPATLGFNWNAMKVDILANFTVDYTCVVESHLRTVEKEED